MEKEIRMAVYDEELKIEACRFVKVATPFPNHFHEQYVIGFVEDGQRVLVCKNKEYTIDKGNIVLFNPGDSHACTQSDEGTLDYRGLTIDKEVMLDLAEEVSGNRELPIFSCNVIYDEDANCYLRSLHELIMNTGDSLEKEENLLFLFSVLIKNYGKAYEDNVGEYKQEIEKACRFMEEQYMSHICLDQICRYANLSKSTLLRAFTKAKGITPYRYLENIRINEARKLLGQGVSPLDAAIRIGFADQSHFTNYFKNFIGLAPGVYRDIFREKNFHRENRGCKEDEKQTERKEW